MVVRLNQVKSFHKDLNIMYLGTFEYKMILLLTFFSFLSAVFFFFFFNRFNSCIIPFLIPTSELREDNCPPSTYLVEGVKALISALRTWLKREVRVLTVTSTVQLVIVTRSETSSLFVLICWMCVSDQQPTSFFSQCALLLFCRWLSPPVRYRIISGQTISLKSWLRKSATWR